jgi:uncharacterized protein
MGNPITWFEISVPEPDQNAKFYSELFGWHTDSVPGDQPYILIDTHSGKGINGGIGKTQEGQPPSSTVYVEGPDIQALLDKAERLGTKTIVPVTEIPDMATFALVADPWGVVLGLVKGEGEVKISDGDNPPMDWVEIGTPEPQKAWDLYRELFGWKIEGSEIPGGQGFHGQIDTGGPGARGGIGSSPDGKPRVTLYAAVDDLQKYLERAEALGAKTIMEPMKVDEHTSIALFGDPQGVLFGLYSYQQ